MSLSFSVQDTALDGFLSFPQSQCPDISVVILLSPRLDSLFQSLKALCDTCEGYAYEVIAVDAQPEQENRELLSRIDGWRVVRADHDLSIVEMLNLGADKAKGKYLAFWVGGLLPLPGWLDEMFRSFTEHPEIGLVGSQINLPDGTLWEAGGTMDADGGAHCMGRGANAAQPEFNYLREVDFCSAISFMIPKDLFKQAGWDVTRACNSSIQIGMQLSVSVRSAGRKVCYNPLSKVVILSRPGENEWNGEYFQLDSGDFDQKSAQSCGPIVKAVVPAGKILFLDVRTPTPDQDSGSQDIVSYFKIFRSLGFEITFIPTADLQFMEKYTPDLQRMGVQCLYTPFVRGIIEYLESHGPEYDLALLYKVHCAAYYIDFVKQYCPKAKIVFDTVDLHFVREQRQAIIEKSQELQKNAQKTKIQELSVIRKADRTIVLSTEEREILLNEPDIIGEKIAVVPLIREIPGRGNSFHARKDILFVGGFEHRPNVDAMLSFVRDIWPLIKKNLPELTFYILGSKPPKEILDLAGDDVIVTGYVSDLSTYFHDCRLSVAPLRYGAGLKGKVATSLSYGLPCVASSSAVEGSGLKPGEEIIVANTPDEFAKAVVGLYLNEALWNDLSERGLDFMNLNFSFAAGRQKLEYLLCELGVIRK